MRDDADIMKSTDIGTHPVHTDLAIAGAIAFHNARGTRDKEARLRYVQCSLDSCDATYERSVKSPLKLEPRTRSASTRD